MNKKKLIAAVLALAMSCSSVPLMDITAPRSVITANAADYDEVTEGDFTFRIYSDHAELVKFEVATVKDVSVPDKASGQPVTVIGDSAFRDNSALTTVTIPDSVKTIGVCAFQECSNLTEAAIGNGVVKIGEYAFSGCKNLVDITLGENVAEIEQSAFSYCSSLTEITLPQSVTVLGAYAFTKCLSLASVKLSDNITVLNNETFFGCKSLRNISLPNKLQKISNNVFRDCSSLKKIVIPDSVVEMGSCAFFYCTSLASAEIGNGLKTVSEYAFADCDKLAELSIGENVIEIQDHAFSGCGALTEVKLPDKLEVLGSGVFKNCSSLTKVTMGDEIATLNQEVFYDCDALKEIRLSEKLKTISDHAFRGCTALEAVTIPATVSVIGDYAFSSTGVKSFDLPASVKTLGEYSLYNCNSLTELIVRNPNMVFKGDLLMPKKVTIRSYADSLAQEYAEENEHPFVLLDSSSATTTTTTTTAKPTATTTTTTAKPTATTTTTTAKPTATTTTTTAKPTATTTTTTAKPTATTTTTTTTAKPTATTTTTTTTAKPTATTTTTTAKPTATTTTTTAKPSATTTTTTTVTKAGTTTAASTTTTAKKTPTNEELLKNADINADGRVDAIDATLALNIAVGKKEPEGTLGDINADGMVDICDAVCILHYYTRTSSKMDVTDYFANIAKNPPFNGSNVTISQSETTLNENAEYGVFRLEYRADLYISGISGQILFNGMNYKEAGFSRIEIGIESDSNEPYINPENGKFYAIQDDHVKNDKLIFRVYGGKAGKYTVSYDDLKFYDGDYVKFTGYTKKDFEPTLTIGTSTVTTTTTIAETTTSAVSTSTTTMTTLFDHASTTTGPVLPADDILKNADVNEDGKIDSIDSLKIMNNMLADKNEFTGGKGDVNGDEIADFRDAYGIIEYYGRLASGGGSYYDMTECFKRTTKTNRTASISQTAVNVGEMTPNSEIRLEFSADVPINAVSGQILFNGKTAFDAGISRLEIYSSNNKFNSSINSGNGKFCAYGSDNGNAKNGSIIFSFTPNQPGEYVITYDDLKFYGADFAEFSGYKKNGFDPYLTVAVPATSTITTPSPYETTTTTTTASIEQLLKNADVDGSGKIDAVDASLIQRYLMGDNWDGAIERRNHYNASGIFEGIGDISGDGRVNVIDPMAIFYYYARSETGHKEEANEFLINLSKAPRIMEKSVTISQEVASGNENDEYCEFVLNMSSELPIIAAEGKLLFNGKAPYDVGVKEIEEGSKKCTFTVDQGSGYFNVYTSFNKADNKLSFIFQVYGIKAGEYSISYGDLKFYGTDGTEYRGIIKKDFDPYLTVNAAPVVPVLTNEQLMKNADIDCDGKITMSDVSALNSYICGNEWMLLPSDGVTQYPEEGKGDVNGDGKVNIADCIFLNEYYDKLEKGEDVSEYFIGLTKPPKTIDKKVTISQAAVSGSEDDDYCEFVLKYSSEVPVSAVEGTLLLNGKPVSEVGFLGAEYTKKDDAKYIYDVNGENGKIAVRSVSEEKNTVDTIIFRILKPKAGEYTISYDDLKFYGPDCAEFSGYEKKDFNPYLTVNAASSETKKSLGDVDGNGIIDAVDASKISVIYARLSTGGTATEEEKAVCDVNKDGLIDAVDASKVRAYYAHVSTGGKLTLEEFLKK